MFGVFYKIDKVNATYFQIKKSFFSHIKFCENPNKNKLASVFWQQIIHIQICIQRAQYGFFEQSRK